MLPIHMTLDLGDVGSETKGRMSVAGSKAREHNETFIARPHEDIGIATS